jgi:hypothetical protein
MEVEVRQWNNLWGGTVNSIEEIMVEITKNPYNAKENHFIIFSDDKEYIIYEGKISLLCDVEENDEFWFDTEESQAKTQAEIEWNLFEKRS